LNQTRTYRAFLWHAVFLSIAVTFTEINTVIPALILEIGGRELHVGIVTAIMIGIPLLAQLSFAGYLQGKTQKKAYLIGAIVTRVLSLAALGATILGIRRFSMAQALLLIYGELLLFTVSGAFAGISYVDLLGKGLSPPLLRRFFPTKQLVSGVGILLSALGARYILGRFPYPHNYALLFTGASLFLFVAISGFWTMREEPSPVAPSPGLAATLAQLPALLRQDKNLRTYILYNNLMGTTMALIPFYLALARRRYTLDPALAGNVLFVQIVGNILAGLIWPRLVRRGGYRLILRVWSATAAVLPVAALAVSALAPSLAYVFLFLPVGLSVSARLVTQDAMIVQLSNAENRVLYTGIVGTLNLTVAIFPILMGLLIRTAGYVPVFLGVSLAAAASFYSLRALDCGDPRA